MQKLIKKELDHKFNELNQELCELNQTSSKQIFDAENAREQAHKAYMKVNSDLYLYQSFKPYNLNIQKSCL